MAGKGKKDFSAMNTAPVYGAIADATAETQEAQTTQEVRQVFTTELLRQNGIGGMDIKTGEFVDTDGNPIKKKTRKPTKVYSPAEAEAMASAGTTQGRKGCYSHRINMAFSDEVHAYITTMARVRGETITQFTNYIFMKSIEDNAEIYEKAKAFKEML